MIALALLGSVAVRFQPAGMAAITAVLYMLMSYPLSVAANWNERRLQKGSR